MRSDQTARRNQNKNEILRELHFQGPLQRSVLADRLGIRRSSVGSIASELIEQGVLQEQEPGAARSPLALDATRLHVLAARVTSRTVNLARVYMDGRTTDNRRVSLGDDNAPARVVEELTKAFTELSKSDPDAVIGVGVASPGLIDPDAGEVKFAANLHGWRDIPLARNLARRIRLPVLVDHDGRAQLWSAAWFGKLIAQHQNLIYLGIQTGLGCSLIVHGRRVSGGRFAAGELGHVRAGDEGRLCNCGKMDCLETYCSRDAILAEVQRVWRGPGLNDLGDIASHAKDSPVVRNVLHRVAERLVGTLAPVLAAIDPDALILASPHRDFTQFLVPPVEHHLQAQLTGLESRRATVVVGDSPDTTAVMGVAGLVIERAMERGFAPVEDVYSASQAFGD